MIVVNRILWLICVIAAIVALVQKDLDNANHLILLALILGNSADLEELEAEVKRLKRGK